MVQLVSGVARLHDLRIVHRDIKPHNILLSTMDAVIEYGDSNVVVNDGAGASHTLSHSH